MSEGGQAGTQESWNRILVNDIVMIIIQYIRLEVSRSGLLRS